jgi:hypothetical protein
MSYLNQLDLMLRQESTEVRKYINNHIGKLDHGVIGPMECVELKKLLKKVEDIHNYKAAFQHGKNEAWTL